MLSSVAQTGERGQRSAQWAREGKTVRRQDNLLRGASITRRGFLAWLGMGGAVGLAACTVREQPLAAAKEPPPAAAKAQPLKAVEKGADLVAASAASTAPYTA